MSSPVELFLRLFAARALPVFRKVFECNAVLLCRIARTLSRVSLAAVRSSYATENDHLRVWECTRCGYKNPIDISVIYNSEDDWKNKNSPVDPEKFYQALKRRTQELD